MKPPESDDLMLRHNALPLDGQFLFHLDQPESATVLTRNVLFSGWCYHAGGEPLTGLRLVMGKKTFVGTYGRERPDVAKHFSFAPGAQASGFQVKARMRGGVHTLRFEIRTQDGRWLPFAKKVITCKPTPLVKLPWVWARFCLQFRRSFSRAWADLPVGERETLQAMAETRGQFPLGLLDQYPSRAVVPEKFPRPRLKDEHLPKISIVTPSYNQGVFLRQTIESVLGQNYPHLDYFVIDGASQDASVDVIREFAPRLKYWTSEPDRGQSDALCKGFARVTCNPDDVLAYLNSDDTLLQGTLRFVAEYFVRHPEVDVLYGHRILIDDSGGEIGRWISPRHDPAILRIVDFVPQETLFWRKRIHDRVGGIDPSFHFAMDWDLILRFQEAGAVIRRVPRYLGCFRVHEAQKTTVISDVGRHEVQLLQQRHLGRHLDPKETFPTINCCRVESGILSYLLSRGIRI